MSARTEVHHNGVYYDDIDWSKEIHSMGQYCDVCGADGAEGHLASCYYLWYMMETPRGRTFLQNMIKDALEREGRI